MDAGAIELVDFERQRLDELIRMWRQSFEAGVGIVDPHPLDEQRQYFLDSVLPHHAVRLTVLEGRLVGFVAASAESVAQLHVRVGWQRRGIGTRMLDWAKQQSAGSLWLFTFARNHGARAFYARQGFVEVAYGFEPTWQLDDVRLQWPAPAPSAH
jgi:GNAT superfamily N-acetyltransferase